MDNSQRILQQLDKMDRKLDKNIELANQNCENIKLINQALRGNGGKGLFKRMDDAEAWQKEHEKNVEEKTKMSREQIRAERAREAVIMAAIIGGVTAVITTVLTLVL